MTAMDQHRIEEIESSDSEAHSDAGNEAAGAHEQADDAAQDGSASAIHARGEKKARKLLSKIGLERVSGVSRVTMQRTRNVIFVIDNAEVYRNPGTDSYIVFGQARVEDLGAQAQLARAQQYQEPAAAASAVSEPAKVAEVKDDENIDPGDLDDADIDLVKDQANCTRAQAIKALLENDKDVVNSIMALSQ